MNGLTKPKRLISLLVTVLLAGRSNTMPVSEGIGDLNDLKKIAVIIWVWIICPFSHRVSMINIDIEAGFGICCGPLKQFLGFQLNYQRQ